MPVCAPNPRVFVAVALDAVEELRRVAKSEQVALADAGLAGEATAAEDCEAHHRDSGPRILGQDCHVGVAGAGHLVGDRRVAQNAGLAKIALRLIKLRRVERLARREEKLGLDYLGLGFEMKPVRPACDIEVVGSEQSREPCAHRMLAEERSVAEDSGALFGRAEDVLADDRNAIDDGRLWLRDLRRRLSVRRRAQQRDRRQNR